MIDLKELAEAVGYHLESYIEVNGRLFNIASLDDYGDNYEVSICDSKYKNSHTVCMGSLEEIKEFFLMIKKLNIPLECRDKPTEDK